MKAFTLLLLVLLTGTTGSYAQNAIDKSYFTNGDLEAIWFEMGPERIQVVRFYPGGQIQEVGNWFQGHLHGSWALWAENGQKIGEAHYVNGRKTGCWRLWNAQGEWQYDLWYERDQLVDARACAMLSR